MGRLIRSRVALVGGLLLAGLLQAVSLAWPGPSLLGLAYGDALGGLQVLSLVPLAWALRSAPSWRVAGARGWAYATAWLVGTFWWLFISMHTYGGMAAPLAASAVAALAAGLALYYALAAACVWRWRRAPVWAWGGAFASCWTLAELARGQWLTGFPWGAGGYAQVDALGWLAPWAGVYGMGWLSAFGAAVLAHTVATWREPSARWWAAGLLVAVLAGGVLAGRESGPVFTESAGSLPVTLLQGNVPQNEKFQSSTGVPQALGWYAEQVRQALGRHGARPALVVAPETAIPVLPQELDPRYWSRLLQMVAAHSSAVMLGVPLGNAAEGFTNSVLAWGPDLDVYRYDKHHLVPFGEFIPPWFRWFTELMHMPLGDFNRGALGQEPFVWAGQRIAPHICYEDLFGEELAASFGEQALAPTVLVNVSNIAWFGDSVATAQHRNISRVRAQELQRPLLRATNTGATVVVDHWGRVTHEWPRLTRGVLDAEVQGRQGVTPFAWWAARWGQWPWWGACGLLIALLWRCRGAHPRGRDMVSLK